jgi:hypothetical protein
MKDALEKWLSPEDANEEGDIISEPASNFDNDLKDLPWEKEESKFSLDTSKSKQSKEDQFDNLFN